MSEMATPTPTPAIRDDGRGELIGRLKAKLKDAMLRLKAAEERATRAEGSVEEARTAAQQAEAKYSTDALKAELDRLQGEVRTTKHRTAFDAALTEAGAPKDALDLLWRESGWKTEADAPDPAELGKTVEALKSRADLGRFFGEPPLERKPGPGRGQGTPVREGSRIKATTAQIRDPDWCWRNRAALRKGLVDQID